MKRINPRLAKLHRSYTAFELADLLGVHKNSVRLWIKQGLPAVDGARPTLICGSDFQAWWAKRRKEAKRPCQPGRCSASSAGSRRHPRWAWSSMPPRMPPREI
jgi:hypothetical protein